MGTWGDVASWVAAIAAVAALVIAVRADRQSRRAATESAADARRAVEAAEQAAVAATRQADLAEAAATKYVVPWSLDWAIGDTYSLENGGTERTFGVTVSATELELSRRFDEPATIDPRSAVTFLSAVHSGISDRTIVVSWHRLQDCSDEAMSWRHPLPFRPR